MGIYVLLTVVPSSCTWAHIYVHVLFRPGQWVCFYLRGRNVLSRLIEWPPPTPLPSCMDACPWSTGAARFLIAVHWIFPLISLSVQLLFESLEHDFERLLVNIPRHCWRRFRAFLGKGPPCMLIIDVSWSAFSGSPSDSENRVITVAVWFIYLFTRLKTANKREDTCRKGYWLIALVMLQNDEW